MLSAVRCLEDERVAFVALGAPFYRGGGGVLGPRRNRSPPKRTSIQIISSDNNRKKKKSKTFWYRVFVGRARERHDDRKDYEYNVYNNNKLILIIIYRVQ